MIGYAVRVMLTVEMRNVYKILVGKPKGKKLFGRRRRGWEDNIKMNVR
jgi:hypothetical protein